MQLLDVQLDSSILNIALDEALLEQADSSDCEEVLRIWEPPETIVVVGRSSPIEQEVKLDICRHRQVDVFRRSSGGATIAAAPGCLMYTVLLDYRRRPQLRMLEQAHQFVMNHMREAIRSLNVPAEIAGICDLVVDGRKFSGNALRCKRNWMFYHGTILCESFDLGIVEQLLGSPKRQPEYRKRRSHRDFLTSIPASSPQVRKDIIDQWGVDQIQLEWPEQLQKS